MKNITLTEFYDKIKELAEQDGKTYVSAEASLNSQKRSTFSAYIEDYGWALDKHSPDEVIEYFNEKINPKSKEEFEVEL